MTCGNVPWSDFASSASLPLTWRRFVELRKHKIAFSAAELLPKHSGSATHTFFSLKWARRLDSGDAFLLAPLGFPMGNARRNAVRTASTSRRRKDCRTKGGESRTPDLSHGSDTLGQKANLRVLGYDTLLQQATRRKHPRTSTAEDETLAK